MERHWIQDSIWDPLDIKNLDCRLWGSSWTEKFPEIVLSIACHVCICMIMWTGQCHHSLFCLSWYATDLWMPPALSWKKTSSCHTAGTCFESWGEPVCTVYCFTHTQWIDSAAVKCSAVYSVSQVQVQYANLKLSLCICKTTQQPLLWQEVGYEKWAQLGLLDYTNPGQCNEHKH